MYQRELTAVLDIETSLDHSTIWMVGLYFPSSGTSTYVTSKETLQHELQGIDTLVGHNLLGFDMPVLHDVWGYDWHGDCLDTLVIGRLLDPSADGGHSLRAWARRAGGELKDDFDPANFDLGLTDDMITYCLQDCRANWDVFLHMMQVKADMKFSDQSVRLELDVARLTKEQERNGFCFDEPTAFALHNQHKERMHEIEKELQDVFPPIVEERYSDKTGKRLKDKVTVFNPGSRQQVAERLEAKGAVWKTRTETGKAKVDETTLAENKHVPEAALVLEYLTLSKRLGMLKSWLDNVKADGRIHGRVNTCGANTHRMTHSNPNMAQIPSESMYRQCFTVPSGSKLVGVDASALELRLLAHYMQDADYIKEVLEGDVHTANQNAFKCETRAQAKTIFYAMAYGAGDAKLGEAIGGSAKEGRKLRDNFLRNLPAYSRLLTKVQKLAQNGTLPGLDGRRIHVRSEHSALNTLLQSAGAIIMKKALVIASERLAKYRYPYKLVAQVHDEFQIEVPEEYAERVGVIFRNAIREAGRCFQLRCPMDGEYQVGDSWADTH